MAIKPSNIKIQILLVLFGIQAIAVGVHDTVYQHHAHIRSLVIIIAFINLLIRKSYAIIIILSSVIRVFFPCLSHLYMSIHDGIKKEDAKDCHEETRTRYQYFGEKDTEKFSR